MDLLTGYGSDGASDQEEDQAPQPKLSPARGAGSLAAPTTAPAAPLPRPAAGPKAATVNDSPDPLGSAGTRGSLLSRLPPPSTQPSGPSQSTSSSMFGLPPPSGPSGSATRKVVTMQLPFRKELLAAAALSSDEEDEPAKKRIRTGGGKSRLMDFLPPPKNDTRGLGSRAVGPPAASAPAPAPAGTAAASAGTSAAAAGATLPTDFFSGGAPSNVAYNNEAFRVPQGEDGEEAENAPGPAGYPGVAYHPGHQPGPPAYPGTHGMYDYSYSYDYTAAAGAAAHAPGPMPGPGPSSSGRAAAAAAFGGAGAPVELVEEALRAEAERASRRAGGGGAAAAGVKLMEISAKDLTRKDPGYEAGKAVEALGSDYALSLRRSAAPFEGSKTARRKHQIGTLLFNARMQELDQMDKRTQGQKSKAETAAKYGW